MFLLRHLALSKKNSDGCVAILRVPTICISRSQFGQRFQDVVQLFVPRAKMEFSKKKKKPLKLLNTLKAVFATACNVLIFLKTSFYSP